MLTNIVLDYVSSTYLAFFFIKRATKSLKHSVSIQSIVLPGSNSFY